MTPNERETIILLRDQYEKLHGAIDDVVAACAELPPVQAANMKRQYASTLRQALNSYVEAENRILGENDDLVNDVNKKAKEAQETIDVALQNLANIKVALNTMTAVVANVANAVAALS